MSIGATSQLLLIEGPNEVPLTAFTLVYVVPSVEDFDWVCGAFKGWGSTPLWQGGTLLRSKPWGDPQFEGFDLDTARQT